MTSTVKQELKNFLPMTTTPKFNAIPQLLKVLPRWLCWQLIPKKPNEKKDHKPPMTPKNGKLVIVDPTNPKNWLTFDKAISYYEREECSGIGFALTDTPPKVCCVDVDNCVNPDGTLNDEANAIIELCGNSWTEISQSGTGIHIWFIDENFSGGRRKGNVEVYAVDRYIAMTGNKIQSTETEIKTVNGACNTVIDKFMSDNNKNLFDTSAQNSDNINLKTNATLSDADRKLIEFLRSDKCRTHDLNMFNLFSGNVEEYFKNTGKGKGIVDDSVADYDLILKILHYVGGEGSDADIAHRALKIFGQSALAKRDKWITREDYRQRTINAAFKTWANAGRIAYRQTTTSPKPKPEPMSDDGEVKFAMTQDKIKNCPANLRIPNNFIFSKNGIYQIVETKKETKYLLVTQTPIVPTKIFFEPSKGTDEYEVAILSRNKWRRVEVDAKTLGDARALNMLCDYGALIIDNLKLKNFFAAIIALNPDMTEVKAYNKTGWTNDECTEFIYPHEKAPYIIRRNGFDFNKIFKPKGNPELWKRKFAELTEKGGAVACAYFGFALSAPLAKPIIGANPSAHLFGKSGGGKTALLKFIASTFGNPRELIRNFAATNKNRLLVAAVFDGLPTFFDELETIQGKTAEEALSTDVYNFCDGKGNQANKRDGTAREIFNFRASRLTTGERQILKQHDLRGAFKRLLPLGMKTSNRLPDELATDLHFFAESNFGHFGKIWTDFVATHLDDIKRKYEFFAKFYASQKKYEPTHLKFLSAAVVSFEYFTVAIGLKSEFDKCACVRLMRAIVDTLPTTEELDDTKRAIEALGSYVAAHEKSFTRDEKDNATSKPIEIGAWGTTCSGKIFDTGEVAFHPTELKRILEDELKFASADKLIAEWNEQGNLLFSDKGRTTHLIRIGSKVYRTVHFRANIISTDFDSAEEKYYEELTNS